ncbi:MAG TPA: hypothetical protein VK420_11595 [Longimicrobium sp.]|jgi:hypothetical protein|nr:hypothetical protein [Longimicrobium sp.]
MEDALRVLFLASDPFRERAGPRLRREVRAIEAALGGGAGVELVPCFAPRTPDLQDALLRHDPRIVHFAGHGDDRGVVYLADAHGRRGVVAKEALAKLFGILSEWIRVVVVNGSGTLPVVEALSEVVDYAIGMDRPLGDASAAAFAVAFYGALGTGMPVRAAFDVAVSRLGGHEDAATPVLRIRPGVDAAVPLTAAPAGTPPRPRAASRWRTRVHLPFLRVQP